MKNKRIWITSIAGIVASVISGAFMMLSSESEKDNIAITENKDSIVTIIHGNGNNIQLRDPKDIEIINHQLSLLDKDENNTEKIEILTKQINELRSVVQNIPKMSQKAEEILEYLKRNKSEFGISKKHKSFVKKLELSNCSQFPEHKTDCDECFKSRPLYTREFKTFGSHTFNNQTDKVAVYLLNENKRVIDFQALQEGDSFWFTTPNMFDYNTGLNSGTSPSYGKYYYFPPNSATKYLISRDRTGFGPLGFTNKANRLLPAYRAKFTINYRWLNPDKTLSKVHTLRTCTFYYGAWCGDGLVDSQYGEECDDGNLSHIDSCNNYCKLN